MATAAVAVAALAVVGGLSLLNGGLGPDVKALLTSTVFVLLPGLLVAGLWVFGIRRYRAPWRTLGLARPRARSALLLPWLALLASLGFGGVYVLVLTAAGLDSALPPAIPEGALGEGPYWLVNVAVIAFIGPLAEEMFFRGFLLAALVQSLGASRGAIAGSAVFALLHFEIAIMVPVFVSGLLLSWLYLRMRSIWPSFTAHAAQNLIVVAVAS
jgi:membrane protease YdiL (CAAX protease family)